MRRWRRRWLISRRPLAVKTLVVTATPGKIDAVHRALEDFWVEVAKGVARYDPGVRLRVDTAVAELASNIVQHAYPPSVPPGTMRLSLRSYSDGVEVTFTDRGVPYTGGSFPKKLPESLRQGRENAPLLPEQGMGLGVISSAVDEVRYHRTPGGRNQWKLVKRFAQTHA
jgi:anti-sigma regulatory factor (Ser/Thr protein kinase)